MPDIRTTGYIDEFNRADENPIQPPWKDAEVAGAGSVYLGSNHFVGDVGDSTWYYDDADFAFTGNGEVWGVTHGAADETEAWRIGFFREPGAPGSTADGYLALWIGGLGGQALVLRRYDNGALTTIGSTSASSSGVPIFMVRRNGIYVECWESQDGEVGEEWEMQLQVEDTTYTEGLFYPVLGISSDDGTGPAWDGIGGGKTRVQSPPRIIRRRKRRGAAIWTP